MKLYIKFCKNNIHINLISTINKTIYKESLGNSNKRMHLNGLQQMINNFIKYIHASHVILIFSGFNKNKINIIKILVESNVNIFKIYHVSQKPFNGCRKRKIRRLLFFRASV